MGYSVISKEIHVTITGILEGVSIFDAEKTETEKALNLINRGCS
jgi:hypothetical protein